MIFALQDEPEKGHRIGILAVGAIVAAMAWGGGIYGASRYQPPDRKKQQAIRVQVFKPKPKPPEPKKKAPETKPPEPKKEAPKTEAPKPKPKRKPKRRPKPKPKPPKPKPEAPASATPNKPVVLPGITMDSTDARGRGPAVQASDRFGGGGPRKAAAPQSGGGAPPAEPPKPPVRKGARTRSKVRPKYTRAALRAGVEGKVVLLVTIGGDGKVKRAKVIKGLGYGLDESALQAIEKWTFAPATVDGAPIQSTKRINVDFVIED